MTLLHLLGVPALSHWARHGGWLVVRLRQFGLHPQNKPRTRVFISKLGVSNCNLKREKNCIINITDFIIINNKTYTIPSDGREMFSRSSRTWQIIWSVVPETQGIFSLIHIINESGIFWWYNKSLQPELQQYSCNHNLQGLFSRIQGVSYTSTRISHLCTRFQKTN